MKKPHLGMATYGIASLVLASGTVANNNFNEMGMQLFVMSYAIAFIALFMSNLKVMAVDTAFTFFTVLSVLGVRGVPPLYIEILLSVFYGIMLLLLVFSLYMAYQESGSLNKMLRYPDDKSFVLPAAVIVGTLNAASMVVMAYNYSMPLLCLIILAIYVISRCRILFGQPRFATKESA